MLKAPSGMKLHVPCTMGHWHLPDYRLRVERVATRRGCARAALENGRCNIYIYIYIHTHTHNTHNNKNNNNNNIIIMIIIIL